MATAAAVGQSMAAKVWKKHKTHQNNVNSLSGSNLVGRPSVGYKNLTHRRSRTAEPKDPDPKDIPIYKYINWEKAQEESVVPSLWQRAQNEWFLFIFYGLFSPFLGPGN